MNCTIGKSVVKFYIIRDFDGEVRGYSLGDKKLVKHYGWGNTYSWVIAGRDVSVAVMDCDFWKQYDRGEIELVESCKLGKERLVDMYIDDVKLW